MVTTFLKCYNLNLENCHSVIYMKRFPFLLWKQHNWNSWGSSYFPYLGSTRVNLRQVTAKPDNRWSQYQYVSRLYNIAPLWQIVLWFCIFATCSFLNPKCLWMIHNTDLFCYLLEIVLWIFPMTNKSGPIQVREQNHRICQVERGSRGSFSTTAQDSLQESHHVLKSFLNCVRFSVLTTTLGSLLYCPNTI